jgi:hypothetical protein
MPQERGPLRSLCQLRFSETPLTVSWCCQDSVLCSIHNAITVSTHTFLRQKPQLQHATQPEPHEPRQAGHHHSSLSMAASQFSPWRLYKHLALRRGKEGGWGGGGAAAQGLQAACARDVYMQAVHGLAGVDVHAFAFQMQ